jgi:hypothetical protein
MHTQKVNFVKLRCYAYRGESGGTNGYYAICLDLSLSTWRPTLESAKNSLNDAIVGYVKFVVRTEPDICPDNFEKYILRPAPFFPFWARYYLLKFFSSDRKKTTSPKIYEKDIDQNRFCTAPA